MSYCETDSKLLESKMVLNGFTRIGLARKIGVSRDTIGNLLNRKTDPSYRVMVEIVNALNLEPNEAMQIFFGKNLPIKKVDGRLAIIQSGGLDNERG